MQEKPNFNFDDEEQVSKYVQGPPKFVPGYSTVHRMVHQLFCEVVNKDANILVLGAGGGLELKAFSDAASEWTFTGVDPSLLMLNQARKYLGESAQRVEWIEGYITDAPSIQFDAASCLMTLHMIPSYHEKLATLKEIYKRLKPGAPFAIMDNCIDVKSTTGKRDLNRYSNFAISSGVDAEFVNNIKDMIEEKGSTISPEKEVQLLIEAGFVDVQLFFVGMTWHGWICYK